MFILKIAWGCRKSLLDANEKTPDVDTTNGIGDSAGAMADS